MPKPDKVIDLELHLHHETKPDTPDEGGYLVSDDGDRDRAVWIAKSLVEKEPGRVPYTFTMPEWLAVEKGLV